ncbi:hypothetical protein AK812_SmicGene28628 [Symbiodinium microadriaticum]|uniref:Uncharacterized protein n=1 Tax=Symbiodinium microadriaticum TaxID=2951 RepID=A0A1Q9D3W1_SYMMI|nr:hypothetical protein AK812_SmicGene28628 [Symbiodinium microadriaticum]
MAYLENRSAQDALDRASAHCPRVRAVLRAQRQDKISIYADRGTGRLNAEEASYCPLTFDRLLMSCRDPDLRHVKAQHAEAFVFHSAVLKWLEGRTTSILSPCQFCGTDFKVMESHMKDALRQEIQDVTSQEILAAADQANLLSAMMRRAAQDRAHHQHPREKRGSRRRRDPSRSPWRPKRDKRAAESANPEGKGNGDQEKWPKPSAKGNARTSDAGWQRDHSQASNRRRGAQDRAWGSRDWPNNQGRSDRHWRSDSDRDRDQDKAILNLCGRLLLRHEDQFGINRSQDNYVMFAQCQGMLSMVPELDVAAEAWVEMIMTSEETIQQAKDMLILDEQCNVPYLEWNRTTRALQVKRDRDPMTLTQVLELLKTMQTLVIQPMTVMRFHATRELCQEMKAEVVPLLLQVGSRTAEGHQLWNSLQRLCHSAACRVTAVSLRGDRMGRSALGVAVQKLVENMYGA